MKTYSIDILGVKSNIDNGFVFEINWTAYIVYDGLSTDEGYYTVYKKGTSEFVSTEKSFIPFSELDEDTVKSWVVNGPEYADVLLALESELAAAMQPKEFSEEIPWQIGGE